MAFWLVIFEIFAIIEISRETLGDNLTEKEYCE